MEKLCDKVWKKPASSVEVSYRNEVWCPYKRDWQEGIVTTTSRMQNYWFITLVALVVTTRAARTGYIIGGDEAKVVNLIYFTEMTMSSFWRNFGRGFQRKSSCWQLGAPVMKILFQWSLVQTALQNYSFSLMVIVWFWILPLTFVKASLLAIWLQRIL